MRVGIEIPYYAQGARGAYQYGCNLTRALGVVAPSDEFIAFTYFYRDHPKHFQRLSSLAGSNVRLDIPHWPQRLVGLAEQKLGYPWVDRRFLAPRKIDVFHDAGTHLVDTRRTALVYTSHGSGFGLARLSPDFEKRVVPHLFRCTRIIAHCQVLRDFLLKYYPLRPEKIRLVYFGVDHSLFQPIDDRARLDSVRRKYGLPQKFLLAVGPFQFRDNIEHLLCVFQRLQDHRLLRGMDLVLAGGLEEHGLQLVDRVQAMGLQSRVKFAGYVPHEDLCSVYNLAESMIHLSYYEEFGTALREAAASGTPVIASEAGGNRESLGDAAVYFNPHLLDDLQAQLLLVLESADLRAQMRGRGLELTRPITWERAARETLEVYREAAAQRA